MVRQYVHLASTLEIKVEASLRARVTRVNEISGTIIADVSVIIVNRVRRARLLVDVRREIISPVGGVPTLASAWRARKASLI